MTGKELRLAIFCTLGAGAAIVSPETTYAQTVWDQFQSDAQHTGFKDVSLANTFTPAWTRSLGSTSLNPVVADNGRVFVSTVGYFSNQNLYALNASDGSQLWSQDFGAIYSLNPPSYSNGVVYVQSGQGTSSPSPYFRGLDANSGTVVLQTPFSAQWERYQAPTIFNGTAYMNAGYYGGAMAVNLSTGNIAWTQTGLAQYSGWTPAVSSNYVVTYTGGNLQILDPGTGSIRRTIADPNFSWAGYDSPTPVLSGDHAFVTSSNHLSSFNLTTGMIDWSLAGASGQLAISGNEIFSIRNGALYSIDATSGAVNWLWSNILDSGLSFNVIATDNDVFVSGSNGTYVIDRNTHRTITTLSASGYLALGNDQLYVASANGTLSAYNVASVPEPNSVATIGLGLAALAFVRRRNARA